MDESLISILAMVAFFILPLVFGKKRARTMQEENKGDFEEFLSDLGLDEDELEPEAELEKEIYTRPIIRTRVVPVETKPKVQQVLNEDEVKVGKGMSKEEKRKLIIYSEVMSPKYKEY